MVTSFQDVFDLQLVEPRGYKAGQRIVAPDLSCAVCTDTRQSSRASWSSRRRSAAANSPTGTRVILKGTRRLYASFPRLQILQRVRHGSGGAASHTWKTLDHSQTVGPDPADRVPLRWLEQQRPRTLEAQICRLLVHPLNRIILLQERLDGVAFGALLERQRPQIGGQPRERRPHAVPFSVRVGGAVHVNLKQRREHLGEVKVHEPRREAVAPSGYERERRRATACRGPRVKHGSRALPSTGMSRTSATHRAKLSVPPRPRLAVEWGDEARECEVVEERLERERAVVIVIGGEEKVEGGVLGDGDVERARGEAEGVHGSAVGIRRGRHVLEHGHIWAAVDTVTPRLGHPASISN
jgi:hypothetical protein